MKATYCTNPVETNHTFLVPPEMACEAMDWSEQQFGESDWHTWYAMQSDRSQPMVFIIHDDDQALQFRVRWC